MNPCHAHIVDALHPAAQHFGGDGGFLRYGKIRGACTGHGHVTVFGGDEGLLAPGDGAAYRIITGGRHILQHQLRLLRGNPGGQHPVHMLH
ncbi:hypothetical protein D3C81_1889410 [compost metagenome]